MHTHFSLFFSPFLLTFVIVEIECGAPQWGLGMMRRVLFALFGSVLFLAMVGATSPVKGVRSKDQARFSAPTFTCPGSGEESGIVLQASQINDDFCDCTVTGADEPGTSACSGIVAFVPDAPLTHSTPTDKFWCVNKGYKGRYIPTSQVQDGVCDCCDGSDEAPPAAEGTNNSSSSGASVCVDICDELGKVMNKAKIEDVEKFESGVRRRNALAKVGKMELAMINIEMESIRRKISSLDAQIKAAEDVKHAEELKHSQEQREKLAEFERREAAAAKQGLTEEEEDALALAEAAREEREMAAAAAAADAEAAAEAAATAAAAAASASTTATATDAAGAKQQQQIISASISATGQVESLSASHIPAAALAANTAAEGGAPPAAASTAAAAASPADAAPAPAPSFPYPAQYAAPGQIPSSDGKKPEEKEAEGAKKESFPYPAEYDPNNQKKKEEEAAAAAAAAAAEASKNEAGADPAAAGDGAKDGAGGGVVGTIAAALGLGPGENAAFEDAVKRINEVRKKKKASRKRRT